MRDSRGMGYSRWISWTTQPAAAPHLPERPSEKRPTMSADPSHCMDLHPCAWGKMPALRALHYRHRTTKLRKLVNAESCNGDLDHASDSCHQCCSFRRVASLPIFIEKDESSTSAKTGANMTENLRLVDSVCEPSSCNLRSLITVSKTFHFFSPLKFRCIIHYARLCRLSGRVQFFHRTVLARVLPSHAFPASMSISTAATIPRSRRKNGNSGAVARSAKAPSRTG